MEERKERFVELRVNIKHDLTGLVDERVMINSNYDLDQIIEAINRPSSKMEILTQQATIVASTINSNRRRC